MLTPVGISDLGLYLRCPRLVHFDALGSPPRKASSFHLLLRNLMLGISSMENLKDLLLADLAKLRNYLQSMWMRSIHKSLALLLKRLKPDSGTAQGFVTSFDQILPSEVEVDLRSERLSLSGRLDRLVTNGSDPSIIITGFAPDDGVWKKDRLRLAEYAMLTEEQFGRRIERGQVEYPRSGAIRSVQIHSADRGRLLRLIDRIQQIMEGRLPDRPKEADVMAARLARSTKRECRWRRSSSED